MLEVKALERIIGRCDIRQWEWEGSDGLGDRDMRWWQIWILGAPMLFGLFGSVPSVAPTQHCHTQQKTGADESNFGSIISVCRQSLQPKVTSIWTKWNDMSFCSVFEAFKGKKVASRQKWQISNMITLNWEEELIWSLSNLDKRYFIWGLILSQFTRSLG